MAKWLAMWVGSITAFVIFVIVTQVLIAGDRQFPTSGDAGFKIIYHNDLPLNGTHFFIDTTKNPTKILFIVVVDVENRHDDALLALQIPYSGTLKEESGWQWKPYEESTLLVKKFSCTVENPCSFVDNIQYLELELDEVIDQRQSFRHSVRLWFSDSNPLLDPKISALIGELNPKRKLYKVGFDEIDNAVATVILDKSTDSFGPTPYAPLVPGPRPNTIELDWDIQSGVLHQIDYQLVKERNLENLMLYYTALFGIGLGITSLAIYGAEQRGRRIREIRKLNNDP